MGMRVSGTDCRTGCGMGEVQLCSNMAPCPMGERCIMLMGGSGFCEPARDGGMPRDARAD
jgi:hypothetical protein